MGYMIDSQGKKVISRFYLDSKGRLVYFVEESESKKAWECLTFPDRRRVVRAEQTRAYMGISLEEIQQSGNTTGFRWGVHIIAHIIGKHF